MVLVLSTGSVLSFNILLEEFKKRNISYTNSGQFWDVVIVKKFCLEFRTIIILIMKKSIINSMLVIILVIIPFYNVL